MPSNSWWGPDGHTRLVIATTDPDLLPDKGTWYLATNLPRPGGPHDTPDRLHEPADLSEVVRLYGIRHWIEQSYKQVKDELGWADFQVRSAIAIRRHQTLVNCAFSFCWDTWFDTTVVFEHVKAEPGRLPKAREITRRVAAADRWIDKRRRGCVPLKVPPMLPVNCL